jgi:DNA-binding CsgD family transcriptional regulator
MQLTARDREVLALVIKGAQNKEIAPQLGMSEQAVKEHVSRLLRKFGVPNRAALGDAGARLDVIGESIERSWIPQLFRDASVQIAVTRGPDHRYVVVNAAFAQAVGRDVVGKTMREAFPELAQNGSLELADQVYQTGESVVAHEVEAMWNRGGCGPELTFTDAVLQALRSEDGTIDGLAFFGIDVTAQVPPDRRTRGTRPNDQPPASA